MTVILIDGNFKNLLDFYVYADNPAFGAVIKRNLIPAIFFGGVLINVAGVDFGDNSA